MNALEALRRFFSKKDVLLRQWYNMVPPVSHPSLAWTLDNLNSSIVGGSTGLQYLLRTLMGIRPWKYESHYVAVLHVAWRYKQKKRKTQ